MKTVCLVALLLQKCHTCGVAETGSVTQESRVLCWAAIVTAAEWQVTLLDTLGKRIDFVNEAAAALGLTNVVGLWARAEDAGKNLNGLKQREVRV